MSFLSNNFSGVSLALGWCNWGEYLVLLHCCSALFVKVSGRWLKPFWQILLHANPIWSRRAPCDGIEVLHIRAFQFSDSPVQPPCHTWHFCLFTGMGCLPLILLGFFACRAVSVCNEIVSLNLFTATKCYKWIKTNFRTCSHVITNMLNVGEMGQCEEDVRILIEAAWSSLLTCLLPSGFSQLSRHGGLLAHFQGEIGSKEWTEMSLWRHKAMDTMNKL